MYWDNSTNDKSGMSNLDLSSERRLDTTPMDIHEAWRLDDVVPFLQREAEKWGDLVGFKVVVVVTAYDSEWRSYPIDIELYRAGEYTP